MTNLVAIKSNVPHQTFWWGFQPYLNEEGSKRLWCSTVDGKYPIGWENLKYDADGVFYDVARNSTSNNIAGIIFNGTDGRLKVYMGESYENLTLNLLNNGLYDFTKGYFYASTYWLTQGTGFIDLIANTTYTMEWEVLENASNFLSIGFYNNAFTTAQHSSIVKGSITGTTQSTMSNKSVGIGVRVVDEAQPKPKLRLQITKTSTIKPFTTGIVPNGALKVACDENKSIITKGNKKNTMNSTVFYVYDNKRYEGINNSDYDFSETINSKVFTGAYENNSYKTTLRVNADSSFNGFFRVGVLAGNWNCEYVSQILIYNNPNLTQQEMERELAKDIYLPKINL